MTPIILSVWLIMVQDAYSPVWTPSPYMYNTESECNAAKDSYEKNRFIKARKCEEWD